MSERPTNILTVDVEEWFHILDLEGAPGRSDWDGLESRVVDDLGRHVAFIGPTSPCLVRLTPNAGFVLEPIG